MRGSKESEIKEFMASKGWLDSCVRCYSLKNLNIIGESSLADANAASVFQEELKKLTHEKGYFPGKSSFVIDRELYFLHI